MQTHSECKKEDLKKSEDFVRLERIEFMEGRQLPAHAITSFGNKALVIESQVGMNEE